MPFKRSRPMRKMRNNYVWVGTAIDGFSTITTGAFLSSTLLTVAANAGDSTLMRSRGLISIYGGLPAGGVISTWWGAAGIIKLQDQQTTQIPSPFTQAGAEWIWHSYFANSVETVTAAGIQSNLWQKEIDSKAMRRIDDDEYFALVVENASAQSIFMNYGMRLLMKVGKR